MKHIVFASILMLAMFAAKALEPPVSQQKKAAIDELLVVTGAVDMGEMMGQAFVQQLANALQQSNPDVDP